MRRNRKFSLGAALLIAAAPVSAQNVPTFVTEPRPLFSVGDPIPLADALLSGVTDALRLSDGRVVVANCSAHEIRYYDAEGHQLHRVAAPGTGFSNVELLKRVFPAGGDSVGTYLVSGLENTIGIFAPDGSLARSIRLPFRTEVIGRTADGQFIAMLPEGYLRAAQRPTRAAGRQRLSVTLFRFSATGAVVDSLTGLPGNESLIPEPGSTGSAANTRAVRLGRTAVAAVLPDRVVLGEQDQASFAEYGPDFRLRRRVATITRPELVTDSIRKAWDDARSVLMPAGGVLPVYGSAYADSMPAYRHIVAGKDGRVWVQDPERPGIYPLVWTAYDDGRATARAELPPRFFPVEFGSDWVLGVFLAADAIERVQLLRLTAGALTGRSLSPRDAQPPDFARCGVWAAR